MSSTKLEIKSHVLPRPPVVVVLGHVDHGKTTLLDHIRKANVAGGEAGGITQSIGAYEIAHHDRRITFIDTPGHEAFSKMRARGVKVADAAILVVAIDDGVQQQTKEAIAIIRESSIPFVVALNKIDKEGVDINQVKNELTAENILLEGYGGNISVQPISAKTGKGIPELLDLVLLTADLGESTYDAQKPAEGVILEAKVDSRRGMIATGIMKEGTLRVGDVIYAGRATGKVKGLEDFRGSRMKEAIPSIPVVISGFTTLPEIGEIFRTGVAHAPIGQDAFISTAKRAPSRAALTEDERGLQLVLKADVSGSLETLTEVIRQLKKPAGVIVKVVEGGVGDITDGDVKLAASVKGMVIGFRVKATKAAQNLSEAQRVKIVSSGIIYELIEAIQEKFKALDQTIVKGDLEILGTFGSKGAKEQIVGGKVVNGVLEAGSRIMVERRGGELCEGKILNLQKEKSNVTRLEAGAEGGLLVQADKEIKVGDHLVLR